MEIALLCIPFEKREMKNTETWVLARVWEITRDNNAVQSAKPQVLEMDEERLKATSKLLRLFAPSKDVRKALKRLGVSSSPMPIADREEVPSNIHIPDVADRAQQNCSLDFLVSCCLQLSTTAMTSGQQQCFPNTVEWQGTQRLVCILLRRVCKPHWHFLDEHDGEVLDPGCSGTSALGITLPRVGFSSKFVQQVAQWQSNEQALEHLETLLGKSMDSECKSELIRTMSQRLRQQCNNVKETSAVWSLPSKTLRCGFGDE
jgi:hypothetical protein